MARVKNGLLEKTARQLMESGKEVTSIAVAKAAKQGTNSGAKQALDRIYSAGDSQRRKDGNTYVYYMVRPSGNPIAASNGKPKTRRTRRTPSPVVEPHITIVWSDDGRMVLEFEGAEWFARKV